MKKQGKKLVLALATVALLLAGCKTEVDTSSPQQEQGADSNGGAAPPSQVDPNDPPEQPSDSAPQPTQQEIPLSEQFEALKGQTAGTHTIAAPSTLSADDLSSIVGELKALPEGVQVKLDLSKATGLTTIGNMAFENCTNLTEVTIPESVTTIGEDAFFGCTSLTSVNIPEGVTTIGSQAFHYCTSLTSVTIPSSVTTMEKSAFLNCYSLTEVIIQEGVSQIGETAF